MQLIFGRENAELLRKKYVILDLETITVEKDGANVDLEVYCLIPAEKIGIMDLQHVEDWIKIHNEFLSAYADKNQKLCQDLAEELVGKFGGEVDTFYEEILKRFNKVEA